MANQHHDPSSNAESEAELGTAAGSERSVTTARWHQPLQRVLVALDFAGNSDMVLARLMLLPLARNAKVTLLSVVPREVAAILHDKLRADLALRLDQTAAHILEVARDLRMGELTVSTQVADGHPSDPIVRSARELDAELIIIGKHGRRPLLDLFIGSTAHKVVTHSDVPVLVVSREAGAPYRRPLLATAFDEASVRAMELALRAIDPLVRAGVVVHAFHSPLGSEGGTRELSPDRTKFDEHFRTLAEMNLNTFLAQHARPDFAWACVLRGADARTAIASEALQQGADLVALGTHARTGLERVLLGSVAEGVTMDAGCDVLIARPSALA